LKAQGNPGHDVEVAVGLHSEAALTNLGKVHLVPQDVHGFPFPSYAGAVVAVAAVGPATAVASEAVVDATVAAVAAASASLLLDYQLMEEERAQG